MFLPDLKLHAAHRQSCINPVLSGSTTVSIPVSAKPSFLSCCNEPYGTLATDTLSGNTIARIINVMYFPKQLVSFIIFSSLNRKNKNFFLFWILNQSSFLFRICSLRTTISDGGKALALCTAVPPPSTYSRSIGLLLGSKCTQRLLRSSRIVATEYVRFSNIFWHQRKTNIRADIHPLILFRLFKPVTNGQPERIPMACHGM